MDQTSSRVIRIRHYGAPEVLEPEMAARPTARAGEAIVRVVAAGVSYADIRLRRGVAPVPAKLPLTPGYDVVGTVEACADPQSGLHVGQLVAGLTVRGGYADHVAVRCDRLVPVPAGVDPAEAASLVLNYTTALQMLARVASVQAGQAVLVHNAAGGVGTALVQLARRAGVKVYGTASPAKLDLVASLGAIPIDRTGDLSRAVGARERGGLDAVFEGFGQGWWESRRLLKPRGRLVIYGVAATAETRVGMAGTLASSLMSFAALRALPRAQVSFYSILTFARRRPDWLRADLAELLELLARGEIRPVIAERLPLTEAAQAHRALESRHVCGKIVLMAVH